MVNGGEVAAQVLPYLSAVAGAYGGAVVQRVTDQAADATGDAAVSWGRRMLGRLLGSSQSAQVEAAMVELANHPDEEDFAAAVRAQIRLALVDDPTLGEELAAMLVDAASATGSSYHVAVD